MTFPAHAIDLLRSHCEATSTRVFNARGATLKRCPQCHLGLATCICAWRKHKHCELEFIVLMHRDEVYKPTNTGRLIADTFPDQCHAFLWSRTEPDPKLIELLNDEERQCFLVFPASDSEQRAVVASPTRRDSNRAPINTVVLLDGTWKQARKMYSQGHWMKHLPILDLSAALANSEHDWGNYKVRQACERGQLATAEAAALALAANEEAVATEYLLRYFSVFNEHYLATRRNTRPQITDAHRAIETDG
ncbi:MAG: DTW domain-containing protein [Cellvibrionaceae bacterium]|nr:DTW domain-containing protein [Cellvibrionaceae bacterium]|tara:strand:- start:6809 stop:7555 length:747 start_codon:yes stop_codon:yes gene_type:complete